MTDTIIMQGPGYTIAQTDVAGTAVPYGPFGHPDGSQNYGFMDLRDHPERATAIPEAQSSSGMQAILQAVNAPGFRFMSLGIERALFPLANAKPGEPTWLCGSYIQVAYRDSALNRNPKRFIALSQRILRDVPSSNEHHIGFEMIVEPLRSFFGEEGCHALMVKPLGYGGSEAAALAAWEYAATAVAAVFVQLQSLSPPTQ